MESYHYKVDSSDEEAESNNDTVQYDLEVHNLPDHVFEGQLQGLFEQFGKLEKFKLIKDRTTRYQNVAKIKYRDPENADVAQKKLDNYIFLNQQISVTRPNERHSQGFRGRGGFGRGRLRGRGEFRGNYRGGRSGFRGMRGGRGGTKSIIPHETAYEPEWIEDDQEEVPQIYESAHLREEWERPVRSRGGLRGRGRGRGSFNDQELIQSTFGNVMETQEQRIERGFRGRGYLRGGLIGIQRGERLGYRGRGEYRGRGGFMHMSPQMPMPINLLPLSTQQTYPEYLKLMNQSPHESFRARIIMIQHLIVAENRKLKYQLGEFVFDFVECIVDSDPERVTDELLKLPFSQIQDALLNYSSFYSYVVSIASKELINCKPFRDRQQLMN